METLVTPLQACGSSRRRSCQTWHFALSVIPGRRCRTLSYWFPAPSMKIPYSGSRRAASSGLTGLMLIRPVYPGGVPGFRGGSAHESDRQSTRAPDGHQLDVALHGHVCGRVCSAGLIGRQRAREDAKCEVLLRLICRNAAARGGLLVGAPVTFGTGPTAKKSLDRRSKGSGHVLGTEQRR